MCFAVSNRIWDWGQLRLADVIATRDRRETWFRRKTYQALGKSTRAIFAMSTASWEATCNIQTEQVGKSVICTSAHAQDVTLIRIPGQAVRPNIARAISTCHWKLMHYPLQSSRLCTPYILWLTKGVTRPDHPRRPADSRFWFEDVPSLLHLLRCKTKSSIVKTSYLRLVTLMNTSDLKAADLEIVNVPFLKHQLSSIYHSSRFMKPCKQSATSCTGCELISKHSG